MFEIRSFDCEDVLTEACRVQVAQLSEAGSGSKQAIQNLQAIALKAECPS